MKYYIIAGEASGDLHGSNLVQQLAMADTQASFKGIGGEKMKAANVELLFGLLIGQVGVHEGSDGVRCGLGIGLLLVDDSDCFLEIGVEQIGKFVRVGEVFGLRGEISVRDAAHVMVSVDYWSQGCGRGCGNELFAHY